MPKRLWLFKSDPESFSIADLEKRPKKTTAWDGVRNYQARNFLRDEVKVGDEVLFYHSSAEEETGIVGTAVVVRAGYPDFTAFDPKHDHFDPDSDPTDPTWFLVDVRHQSTFPALHHARDARGASGAQEDGRPPPRATGSRSSR